MQILKKKNGLLFKIHVYLNVIFDITICFTKGIKYMIMLQERLNFKIHGFAGTWLRNHQSELESVHEVLQGV